MAHEDELVAWLTETARPMLKHLVDKVPLDSIRRVDGIQALVDDTVTRLERLLFTMVFERLHARAAEVAGRCSVCGFRCERERRTVRLRTKRCTLELEVWRFRCRSCGTSRCPVRDWLDVESGATTAGLDRALTALSTVMSFGAAAQQMLEHHGHVVDRTLVERRTYAVGRKAVDYLGHRDTKLLQEVMDAVGVRPGAERVFVQVDSGGVPVGKLERPERNPNDAAQPLTPKRKLPVGRRPKSSREVRVVVAWRPGQVEDKVVNLHLSELKHTEVTGQAMYLAALEAGMGDDTHVHGTMDMAQWQALQFDEQFGAQPKATLCADFYHTLEYIAGAARGLQPEGDERKRWLAMQARRLKQEDRTSILADLRKHTCRRGPCHKTDKDECAVVAATRYLTRNGKYMTYRAFIAEELPIGSGEVEGRIRHIVRRRLDVSGDWREEHLPLFTALLTIRHSGWWDDFWDWLDEQDRKRFQRRPLGERRNRFRGPRKPRLVTDGFETLDLDGLSPMFQGGAAA